MRVFLDFEASSLADRGTPIEVAWVFEDGESESWLIRPAPGWDDWSDKAEAIHHISRATLAAEGTPHDVVAHRMVERLTGHQLFASAPSWDGKWLSALLRAAGLPRGSLTLRDTHDARRETVRAILAGKVPPEALDKRVEALLALSEIRSAVAPPAHRALPDAEDEYRFWRAARDAALAHVAASVPVPRDGP